MTAVVKTTGSISEALVALQANLPRVGLDRSASIKSDKGSFSYKYAGLNDVNEALLPALAAVGLAFTALPTIDGDRFVLGYSLLHTSGQERAGVYPLPDPARATPQQIGSAITYARRYCILAVTGLAPDPDDDGQAANHAPASQPMERKAERGPAPSDPWANVEIAKPPVVTDAVWFAKWRERALLAGTLGELRGLHGEMVEQHKTRNLTDEDRRDAEALVVEMKEQVESEASLITETTEPGNPDQAEARLAFVESKS